MTAPANEHFGNFGCRNSEFFTPKMLLARKAGHSGERYMLRSTYAEEELSTTLLHFGGVS